MLIDAHCHLDWASPDELPAILARAAAAGVVQMVVVSCAQDSATVGRGLTLAREHRHLHPVVGVHPHDAKLATDALLAEVERVAADPLVVAVGEIGLDFHYDLSPRDTQREAFRRQIALARRLGKPIVVHSREAPTETLAILREESAADVGGVLHCYSEDAATAQVALDLGFHLSFSGIVTFKSAEGLREVARTTPLDRLLVETDSPYLAPVPHRGKRCEPAYVRDTAELVARLRGMPLEELAEVTTENARRLFRLPRHAA